MEKITIEKLKELMAAKKPFAVTANSYKGASYEVIDWDGKELDENAVDLCKKHIGECYFEFLNFEGFTIICDEDARNKKLEKNDFASLLAKFDVFGTVVVSFPD